MWSKEEILTLLTEDSIESPFKNRKIYLLFIYDMVF